MSSAQPSSSMSSLQVNGTTVASVSFDPYLRTCFSPSFNSRLRKTHPTRQLVTSIIPGYGQHSVLMECEVDPDAPHDVILGLEWAAHIRDFVLEKGFRIDGHFDAWAFLSDPRHPLGFPSGPEVVPTDGLLSAVRPHYDVSTPIPPPNTLNSETLNFDP
ncbi:hypothetical protein C8F04DRAFT_1143581, partial [Mycena alexandri]